MKFRKRYGFAPVVGMLAVGGLGVAPARAQTFTFTTRNGGNVAYCGAPGVGPLINHHFGTPVEVHDLIVISDPGPPFSSASANFDSTPSPTGLSIAVSGESRRVALGSVSCTADGRDSWEFTLDAPACFTFSASLSATSTDPIPPSQTVQFAGFGIRPAPGTPPDTFTVVLSTGSVQKSGTGMLLPGQYFLSINGRSDTTTGAPYLGSYADSVAVSIGPATLASGPMAASSCLSGHAEFSVTAAGAGPFTYQWRVESPADSGVYVDITPGTFFEPSSGLTFDTAGVGGPTLEVSNLELGVHPEAIRFTVRVASICGGSTSDPAMWTICTGDLNCDDLLDFSDYLDFLTLFDSLDPRVDYNHDGVVDFSDYLEFLNHFDTGC